MEAQERAQLASTVRMLAVHRSLTRPILLLGADRELTGMNITFAIALVFGAGLNLYTFVLAAFQLVVLQSALVYAAKYDPQFRHVYARHLRQQSFYPSRSRSDVPATFPTSSIG